MRTTKEKPPENVGDHYCDFCEKEGEHWTDTTDEIYCTRCGSYTIVLI